MGRRFTNWGQTHHSTPARWSHPSSEAELTALVRAAASCGETVKVIGAGHSWSDIAMTDGELVSLDRMPAVLELDLDAMTVTVAAGMSVQRLNTALAARGLALPVLGSISAQTVAGLISTGTHGSSLRWGNLSTLVVTLRLVTGEGELLELLESDPRLDAARVGLGALGVLTRVTFRVVEAFGLVEETSVVGFDEALEHLVEVAREEEYVKWFWLPHTDRVAVFRYRRVDVPRPVSRVGRWIDENVVNRIVFAGVLAVGARWPALIPPINRVVRRAYFRPGRRVGRSDEIFNLAMPPVHRETEWSVPLEQGPEAVRRLAGVIDDGDLRVNFIQEVRLVRGDGAWLSPAHGRDSCHVGAYIGHGRDGDALIEGFCAAMRSMGARPHWGKEMVESGDYLASVYPQYRRFNALRAQLDPSGVFENGFVRRSLVASPE